MTLDTESDFIKVKKLKSVSNINQLALRVHGPTWGAMAILIWLLHLVSYFVRIL